MGAEGFGLNARAGVKDSGSDFSCWHWVYEIRSTVWVVKVFSEANAERALELGGLRSSRTRGSDGLGVGLLTLSAAVSGPYS